MVAYFEVSPLDGLQPPVVPAVCRLHRSLALVAQVIDVDLPAAQRLQAAGGGHHPVDVIRGPLATGPGRSDVVHHPSTRADERRPAGGHPADGAVQITCDEDAAPARHLNGRRDALDRPVAQVVESVASGEEGAMQVGSVGREHRKINWRDGIGAGRREASQ